MEILYPAVGSFRPRHARAHTKPQPHTTESSPVVAPALRYDPNPIIALAPIVIVFFTRSEPRPPVLRSAEKLVLEMWALRPIWASMPCAHTHKEKQQHVLSSEERDIYMYIYVCTSHGCYSEGGGRMACRQSVCGQDFNFESEVRSYHIVHM